MSDSNDVGGCILLILFLAVIWGVVLLYRVGEIRDDLHELAHPSTQPAER